jgi:transcription-repair coupling factor (superfamily II helicase)
VSLEHLIPALSRARTVQWALESAEGSADFSVVEGLRVPLIASLLDARTGPQCLLAIASTGREAEAVQQALVALAPNAVVLDLPAWETLPHERLSPSAETVGRRLRTLRALRDWAEAPDTVGSDAVEPNPAAPNPAAPTTATPGTPKRDLIVVASVRAALQPLAPGLTEIEPVVLRRGGRGYDLARVTERLIELAYSRVDMVTRRGEFAVRGGILDVFAAVAEHPVRVEFFGDEVEQVREFSVADQRSLPVEVDVVELPPTRELLLTAAVRQRAREMQHEFPSLAQLLAKISEGIPVEGMESLAPALVDRLVPLTEYLPNNAAIAVLSPERVASRAVSLLETNREFLSAAWHAATSGAESPIDLDAGDFVTVTGLREAAGSRDWFTVSAFDADDPEVVRIEAVEPPGFAGRSGGAVDHVVDRVRAGWTMIVVAAGHGLVERAADVLGEHEVAARIVEKLPDTLDAGVVYLVQAQVEHGFEVPELKLGLLSETEFYGRAVGYDSRQPKKLASRRANVVDPLQLKAGDFVVHATHGIGKFLELVQREVSTGGRNAVKSQREFLLIEYAPSKRGYPGDKLYVPTDQLDLLSRYVGGEAPSLSKMGGSDWAAAKGKARRAVRDIAVELVKLYSARMSSRGHAFEADTPWQRELEEAFPFVETPDQLTTIDEVKRDMESPIPMDRLLAGDVGYGKTEVAVRAAFKAVQGGKQVAMIVPTTLLVKQHVETFAERFAGFPVHLRALSRFQSDAEAKETIEGLARGTVDVVIGTHRILSQGIQFKDLGLVIIDEEQRFGVEHKESLKKLKNNVDVLAMSATPIPRTLEMAVTGIREMSTLATPPEDRHPILTFVGPYSDKQVVAAIHREMLREGQVFFVHNRVSSIQRVASHLAELVPDARIAVAHGQMSESLLEQVMVDFWERKFDVLVSTTIIETGLDVANANTLIIDRADKYGLSQLHQLRGRVGRGRERAYAYFLYDELKPLTETAHDRLQTIAANSDLGGGMQIALKDLEIRGAGNLLGAEQAGHIAGVGFDLYLRMIGEAVSIFRGDAIEEQTELRLELPVAAHIPEDFIASERLRLEAYQKLSTATAPVSADTALDAVLDELTDRYGDPPSSVLTLLGVSRLRRQAQKLGLSDVIVLGSNLRLVGLDLPDSRQLRLQRMYPGSKWLGQQRVATVPLPTVSSQVAVSDDDLVTWVGQVLTNLYVAEPATAGLAPSS